LKKKKINKKLIVVLGPTASGKSELAIKLAKKFNGEIISADSRQIYKDLNIGTGKVTKKEMGGIHHHLLDAVSPKRIFTSVQYQKLALKTINKIFKKNKIPILVGGTGFYIQVVVDGIIIPRVKPDWKLKEKLEKKSVEELFNKLKRLDPKRTKNIDDKNKRRIIRALEIILKTKRSIPEIHKNPLPYPVLILGINLSKQELEKRIEKRIKKMFKLGLEKEVKNLVKKYDWILPSQTIGYQEWNEYFKGKINKERVKELIILHTKQLAKRQMTWFRRDKRIYWIKNYKQAKKLLKKFL
jgi:tRNA dimethylallyltransferase